MSVKEGEKCLFQNVKKDDDKRKGDEVNKTDEQSKKDEKSEREKDKENTEPLDGDDVESLVRGFRIVSTQESDNSATSTTPPVSILPIPKLHKLLVALLPSTRVKILKVPFPITWRQTFPEPSHW